MADRWLLLSLPRLQHFKCAIPPTLLRTSPQILKHYHSRWPRERQPSGRNATGKSSTNPTMAFVENSKNDADCLHDTFGTNFLVVFRHQLGAAFVAGEIEVTHSYNYIVSLSDFTLV